MCHPFDGGLELLAGDAARLGVPILLIVSVPAWADPGVRVGAHGGVEFGDATDPNTGVDLRLSFSRSPLTVSETYPRDFGDWRVSVGVTFGGPQTESSP
jgi:hypothetical protein